MIETQSSQLLPSLFEYVDEDRRLTVLHLGPAMPETVEFFSRYRSKLYVADLFADLPLEEDIDSDVPLAARLEALLELPADARFDLCLFWDLFNFLDGPVIGALQEVLRPRLHPASQGHGFTSHSSRVRPPDRTYAVREVNELAVRPLSTPRPGYVAQGQGPLKARLDRFVFGRTVLLPDKRLEFLLSVRR
jgi:hypothetical protein